MIKQKIISKIDSSIVAQITLSFCIVFILKWQVLNQPPVWDTAFSVFPAAITLSENGYDFLNLLKMSGYHDGGPNVHAHSIITIITAVMISLFGKTNFLFPSLHIIHFIIAAIGLVYFYRFCIPIFEKNLSFLFRKALSNPNYSAVQVKSFSKGNYNSEILRINRRNEPCTLPDGLLLNQESDDD